MGIAKSALRAITGGSRLIGVSLALASLTGCGAYENGGARSPVDEESQLQGSASLEAYPPSSSEEVAIGVDTTRYEDTDPSAITEFRTVLEPYGTWEDTSTHGTVWLPSRTVVGPDFVPYASAGRWAYDGGWVWVSDYEWGWAPFHYGRWVHMPGRGWAWVPGRVYSGAWVSWSIGPAYVGWAPLAPAWYWHRGYPVGATLWPTPYYVYCPHHAVFSPTVSTVVVHGPAAAPVAATTRPYVPAQPTVDGSGSGRVPAKPTVGPERVAANPTVNPAQGRLPASPTPGELGQRQEAVPRPPSDGNLGKARALATPDEAVRAGARAPASGAGFALGASTPRYEAPERQAFVPAEAQGRGASNFAAFTARPSEVAPSVAGRGAEAVRSSNPNSFVVGSPRAAFEPSRGPATSENGLSARSSARSNVPDPWQLSPPVAERRTLAPSQVDPRPTSSYGASAPYRPSTRITNPTYAAPAPPPASRSSVYSPSTPVFPRSPNVSAPVYRAPSPSPSPVYRAPSPTFSPSQAPVVRAPSAPAPVYRAPSPAPVYRAPSPAPVVRAPAPVSRPNYTPAPAPAARPSGSRSIRR